VGRKTATLAMPLAGQNAIQGYKEKKNGNTHNRKE
jgi:hypothetical protein